MDDPTARALKLLSLLQTHRFWTGTELSELLGVSGRTVRRDVDRIRELGYRIDATPGVAGGYQLAKGTSLPPLVLDDDEAVAVAVGLRSATGAAIVGIEDTSLRAMAKLEQVLPDRLRRRVNAIHDNVSTLRWASPDEAVDAESLAVLAQGCRDHEEVRFEYVARDGTESSRLVEPHRLVNTGRRWYLAAYDTRRNDWRTFRVDRLTRVRLAGGRFRPRPAPADSFEAYVKRSLGSAAPKYEVQVVVHASVDEVRAIGPFRGASVDDLGDGTVLVAATSDSMEWLHAMLAMAAANFELEVRGPDEVAREVARVAARLRKATGPKRGGR